MDKIRKDKIKNFKANNMKVKKSIILNSPIFSVKYSYFRPNLLAACTESGLITIIDTHAEGSVINSNNEFNNTLQYHEIQPLSKNQIHLNTIYDFEWCVSDNKILTASGDMTSVLVNFENNSCVNELYLVGHSKSIKSAKQAFFDEKLFATCGRDGMIYIWDIRDGNRKRCSKHCAYFPNHTHVSLVNFLLISLLELSKIKV